MRVVGGARVVHGDGAVAEGLVRSAGQSRRARAEVRALDEALAGKVDARSPGAWQLRVRVRLPVPGIVGKLDSAAERRPGAEVVGEPPDGLGDVPGLLGARIRGG